MSGPCIKCGDDRLLLSSFKGNRICLSCKKHWGYCRWPDCEREEVWCKCENDTIGYCKEHADDMEVQRCKSCLRNGHNCSSCGDFVVHHPDNPVTELYVTIGGERHRIFICNYCMR